MGIYSERDHPRGPDGRWATKPVLAPAVVEPSADGGYDSDPYGKGLYERLMAEAAADALRLPDGCPGPVARAALGDAPWEAGVGWHYNRRGPARFDPKRRYKQKHDMKPQGLWVSWETCDGRGGWYEWAAETAPDWAPRHQRMLVQIDRSRMLELGGHDDLPPEAYRRLDKFTDNASLQASSTGWFVDWRKVAERYAGISVVEPLKSDALGDHRLWRIGWDVTAACVWDLSAVEWAGR